MHWPTSPTPYFLHLLRAGNHHRNRPGDLPELQPRSLCPRGRVLLCTHVLDTKLPGAAPRESLPQAGYLSFPKLTPPSYTLNSTLDTWGTRIHGHTQPYILPRSLHSSPSEVEAGQIRGPCTVRPLPALGHSGLGVVPNKGNRWQMILHLSALTSHSINDRISKDIFLLHYTTADDMLVCLGPGALMAKADLKSAFWMIPVRIHDWELLDVQWQGQFYHDTCLPFGLRSAPFLLIEYTEALQWILQDNHGLTHILHYLDYLIAGSPGSSLCAVHLSQFLRVCDPLCVPVVMEKVEGPTPILTFLGLELNSIQQRIRLSPEKFTELLTEVQTWSHCLRT